MTHAWMPGSPCGDACVDDAPEQVSDARFVLRVVTATGLLASFPVVNVVTPRSGRQGMQRRYAEALLRCCGIGLQVIDNRGEASPGARFAEDGDGMLVVCGHVGWTDVLALAAVQPLSFVARGDLIDWPLLGRLARKMRVIPIDRAALRTLPDVVATVGARIAAGERIGAFPEGTTWCGRAFGGLRPALFQAAIDTGTAVQPVRLAYRGSDGALSTMPSFIGEQTMLESLVRIMRSAGVTAEIILEPVELPGTDRRDLAARCERAVRGDIHLDFAEHGVVEPTRPQVPVLVGRSA